MAEYDYREKGHCYRCEERIKCVPLEQIEIPEPWAPMRTEQIRQVSVERLMDFLLSVAIEGEVVMGKARVDTNRLPRMSRVGEDKYRISDGIHRTNVAKEMGLGCILAYVEDCPEISCADLESP